MIESLIKWWQSLAQRERKMVSAAGLVVVLAVGYLVLFEPAWRGRRQIEADLPDLRSKVSQMDALAGEARRLATVQQVDETPQVLRRQFEQSLAAAGLKEYISQVTLNGSVIDLRFAAAPFASLVVGLDGALRETRLRVIDATITRDAVNGTASGKLALEGPRRDAR